MITLSRIRTYLTVGSILLSLVCVLRGEEKYRWPLSFDNGITSSFQEFRSNHFHGGFDLRTRQRTGFPVYAVSDGHIFKIRVVKRGSGRGLYLKHTDGNTSIYFHLERFETKLENLLKRVQATKKNKYIDNYFLKKPIFYKKGELIGYSGETGSGFPHLHVEVRDKEYFALNPFKLFKLPGEDRNYPILQGLLTRPSGSASVNGKVGESYLDFRHKSRGVYVLDKPLVVTGSMDISLKTYDRSDVGRHVAPYKISVMLDNRLVYRLVFDRFQRDDNNQLGFVYDLAYSSSSSYFINLFSQEGFALEQQQKSFNQALEKLDYGLHELRILVEDNNRNVSTGLASIFKVRPTDFEISQLEHNKDEDRILLNIERLDAHAESRIYISVFNSQDEKISTGRLAYHKIQKPKPLVLKGVPDDAEYLEFDFFLENIQYLKHRYLLDKNLLPLMTDIDIQSFINRDEIFVKVSNPELSRQNLKLTVIQGNQSLDLEPLCSQGEIYFRFKPLNRENLVLLNFDIYQGSEKVVAIQKRLNVIYLQKGVPQEFVYHEFEASFAGKSVYEPKVLNVEERHYESSFPVLSRQISLMPMHFPFLDTVYFKFKQKLANPQQVGIFKYDEPSKSWSYRFTQYESSTSTYKHRLISSGVFALMRDTFPPELSFLRPGSKLKQNVHRLTVKITDKGKGVNDDSIKIWLNGSRICTAYDSKCEYDPDWKTLKIEELGRLKTGKNSLKIEVADWAGNRTEKTHTFRLQ